MIVPRVAHAQRFEDILLEKRLVGLAGDLLDKIAQDDVPGIRVAPALARVEFERFVPAHNVASFQRKTHLGQQREHLAAGDRLLDAGGVREQLPDGDFVALGVVRQILADGVIDAEPLPLVQDHDGHGGERLGEGDNAKLRLRRAGRALLQIGQAVALLVNHLAVLNDGHGGSRRRAASPIEEQRIHLHGPVPRLDDRIGPAREQQFGD